MHLFVDISSHGFGHLALTAPVLNALGDRLRIRGEALRLTLRTRLPEDKLRARIRVPFELIPEASDFGFVMRDALRMDLAASASAYRRAHADWPVRVAREAAFLAGLGVDGVFSNIAYLPLAGAARAGIPSLALCCLNWADLFAHYFGVESWAAGIHGDMLAAYRSAACFLRPAPAMVMPSLANTRDIGPIAALGKRTTLAPEGVRTVLVAMGGVAHRLPVEDWPDRPDVCWLVQSDWRCRHPRALAWDEMGLSFTDVLASVDGVVTKPGYGMVTEAACNGTAVLYQRRDDWPEQDDLIPWLERHGRCRELAAVQLADGDFLDDLETLLAQPRPPLPQPLGAEEAADIMGELLGAWR